MRTKPLIIMLMIFTEVDRFLDVARRIATNMVPTLKSWEKRATKILPGHLVGHFVRTCNIVMIENQKDALWR